jgi:hypothetical protein
MRTPLSQAVGLPNVAMAGRWSPHYQNLCPPTTCANTLVYNKTEDTSFRQELKTVILHTYANYRNANWYWARKNWIGSGTLLSKNRPGQNGVQVIEDIIQWTESQKLTIVVNYWTPHYHKQWISIWKMQLTSLETSLFKTGDRRSYTGWICDILTATSYQSIIGAACTRIVDEATFNHNRHVALHGRHFQQGVV